MNLLSLEKELSENAYPGRGIVIGKTPDSKHAAIAYFIMGRSNNSRNRIFESDGEGIRTKAFDESKLEDPSLIIYAPVRVIGDDTIVTNGDQTDTVYDSIRDGGCFRKALKTREFEPDAPNFTPRISGITHISGGNFTFELSILKSDEGRSEQCVRYFYEYDAPIAGEGRFIHTYDKDGDPLPSFSGDPKRVSMENDIDEFTNSIWNGLNEDNKVSLFVRYIDIATGKHEDRIINKNI